MNIPYGKVAVYVLTFLGYVYSGYGSGLLGNLREAIVSAEVVFGDVLKKVITVAQKFRTMHDVFDAAVEEECIFKCESGALPKPNRNHIPSKDGCGSLGLKINSDYLPFAAMEECCNTHDICYDTCNADKEVCDLDFKRCLYRHCDGYSKSVGGQAMTKTCKGAAKVLFTGTLTFGCKSYKDAQKNACYCDDIRRRKDKKSKYTSGGDRSEL
ncbi:group XIIA secretory phospholipase A2-like isoform X3 [Anthonomus grandis grandis]|uniref:group XIIA secretory phospholipase A2-like isoform X3 n=1 Tax=Anthonomus grandis grandis TaxID=2921223 RepID=UPI002165AF41|nr:group XIIA secretory phospholipase A2-like isoform X3 [Anthonomus grandis grandis]